MAGGRSPAQSAFATSMPSTAGMAMARRTRSGDNAFARRSAISPSDAVPTNERLGTCEQSMISRSIASGSSSTISVRKANSVFIEGQWHGELDEESAGVARAHAAVTVIAEPCGDAIGDVAQAEASTAI